MNRSIEEINKIVDIVMTDQDVRDALNDRILAENLEQLKAKKAFEDGEEHGKEIGKEIGEEEKTEEIVRQMLEMNADNDFIMKATGITEDKLNEIKENNQQGYNPNRVSNHS